MKNFSKALWPETTQNFILKCVTVKVVVFKPVRTRNTFTPVAFVCTEKTIRSVYNHEDVFVVVDSTVILTLYEAHM